MKPKQRITKTGNKLTERKRGGAYDEPQRKRLRVSERIERSKGSSGQKIRLNRAIASCGLCSRRAADQLIIAGKVSVNGKTVIDFHLLVDPLRDQLFVSGKKLTTRQSEYVLLNKPKGVVSTCQDEYRRKKILDLLPANLRHLKPVGRLDYDSSGLILLTNNGALINKFTHPKSEIEKIYRVTIAGKITSSALKQLGDGMELKEVKTKKTKVNLIECGDQQSTIEIALNEGKNRQIRRMCAQLGLPVLDLVRTGISKLQLGNLPLGKWRYLTKSEITRLQEDLTD